jgi:hypothetical protein
MGMPQSERQAMTSFHAVVFDGCRLVVLREGGMLGEEEQCYSKQSYHFLA